VGEHLPSLADSGPGGGDGEDFTPDGWFGEDVAVETEGTPDVGGRTCPETLPAGLPRFKDTPEGVLFVELSGQGRASDVGNMPSGL